MNLRTAPLREYLRSALEASPTLGVWYELQDLLGPEVRTAPTRGALDPYIVDHEKYGLSRADREYAYYWVSNRELFFGRVAEVHGLDETLAALLELET